MVKRWQTLEKKDGSDLKIFRVNWFKRQNQEIGKTGDFVVLDSPRWVNIIPITKNKEVVLVSQYRHGIDEITLEVPGGLVDPNEEPLDAAERECFEETGYKSFDRAILLGENFPNPAFLNNVCYSYVWFDCELKGEQKLDGNEDIDVSLVSLKEIPRMILNKEIKHSLVLTAFFFYSLKFGF
ncbi:MAG: NUDIX hydrolase [Candidatus Kapabacteria bacterium]|nr:NUDIX hydrolase [Candidatus Kapabacteria bacterium]